jgi:hypothetical protein
MSAIQNAMNSLPVGANGALVAVANEQGVNAAVVVRAGDHFAVTSWIGKSWKGSLEYGAATRVTW